MIIVISSYLNLIIIQQAWQKKEEKNCDKGTNPSDGGSDGEVPKYKR